MTDKKCRKCSCELTTENTTKSRIKICDWICRKCHRKMSRTYSKSKQEIKNILVEVKGGKCVHCNTPASEFESKDLHFHHVDPLEKKYGINRMIQNRLGLSSILKEADKCILLCGSCHIIEHKKSGRPKRAVVDKEGEINVSRKL